jgi:hypothetical protein
MLVGAVERSNAEAARSLLRWGVVVGPLYVAVGLIQALLRDGFVLARHPLSVLANGPGGWVQTANLAIGGAMVLVAAVGFKRALAPTGRAMAWFLGGFGVSMLVASVFTADPMDGFPVGTPLGPPTTISSVGLVHFAAGVLGFISLAVACFVAARAMSRRNVPSLARLSLLSGVVILLAFFGGGALSSVSASAGTLGIWLSVIVGWAWLAIMSHRVSRASAGP